jgi:hypothetical protein
MNTMPDYSTYDYWLLTNGFLLLGYRLSFLGLWAEVLLAAGVPSLAGSASLRYFTSFRTGSFVATLQARQPVGGGINI